jgi:hypothetical protein
MPVRPKDDGSYVVVWPRLTLAGRAAPFIKGRGTTTRRKSPLHSFE